MLHEIGQSLWLDGISRGSLNDGSLKYYINEWSVTGLTFSPTAIELAVKNSSVYDAPIKKKLKEDLVGEDLIFELVLEDTRHAAKLLRPIYDRTEGVDGWVSLTVSPLITHDAASTLAAAKELHALVGHPNVFIMIPGTRNNLVAIEEAIFLGVPVNVTQLFSCEHYLSAADAFLKGIERRIAGGLEPKISSIASMSIKPWGAAVMGRQPDALHNKLCIAGAGRTYKAYCDLLSSPRWQHALSAGVRPQRLLWSGTEISDDANSEGARVKIPLASLTVITMPESTLKTFAVSGETGALMSKNDGVVEAVPARYAQAGIDMNALADILQKEMAEIFVKSWIELMTAIARKSAVLTQV